MSTAIWSVALRDIPTPDYADATFAALDEYGSVDPAAWARRMFSRRDMPGWVALALRLRRISTDVIIHNVSDDEVLVRASDSRLDYRIGVSVDERRRVLRITTTAHCKGARDRVSYPMRVIHPILMRSLVRSAARSFARD